MQPSARDISVVLVSDADVLRYAARSPMWEGSEATLGEVAMEVPPAAVLRREASLREAIDALAGLEFCLLGEEPVFIVTVLAGLRTRGNPVTNAQYPRRSPG